eukprot:Ihof_evm1s334 gene=Ihof_evmTU1s334
MVDTVTICMGMVYFHGTVLEVPGRTILDTYIPIMVLISFFGAAPAQGGGLFGTAKPASSTGFGATAATPFGAPAAAPATGATGFSFGTAANTTAAPAGGLSFGAKPATAPFGTTTQQPASTGFGGFGTTAPTTGVFGSTAAKPATMGFGFGAGAAKPATGIGMFGQPAQQSRFGQPQQPQQPQAVLPEMNTLLKDDSMKPYLEPVKMLAQMIKQENDDLLRVEAKMNEQQPKITQLRDDIVVFTQKVGDIQHKVSSQEPSVNNLRDLTVKDLGSLEYFEYARQPYSNASFESYFVDLCIGFRERMTLYNTRIRELEQEIQSIDSKGTFTGQALLKLMENQSVTFMTLATKVAELNAQMDTAREEWHQLCVRRNKRDMVQERAKEREEERRRAVMTIQAAPRPIDYGLMATRGFSTLVPQQQQAANPTTTAPALPTTTAPTFSGFGTAAPSSAMTPLKPATPGSFTLGTSTTTTNANPVKFGAASQPLGLSLPTTSTFTGSTNSTVGGASAATKPLFGAAAPATTAAPALGSAAAAGAKSSPTISTGFSFGAPAAKPAATTGFSFGNLG